MKRLTITYDNKELKPLKVFMSSIRKDDRRRVAEECLVALRNQCEDDLQNGDDHLDDGYDDAGKAQIVADYLLWSKRFEPYVPPGFYLERAAEIQSLFGIVPSK
jgi:hypothetical protein